MLNTRRALTHTTVASPPAPPDSGRVPATHVAIPGVLVLSLQREPVYITGSAHHFLAELAGAPRASWGRAALPLPVQTVCDALERAEHRDWDKRQAHLRAQTGQGSVRVRGYGVVEGRASRFLILLSTIPAESPAPVPAPVYRFSDQQQAIVDGLVRGETNKEIATTMGISIHTVKEYVRHLMMKLKTHTRTGIVAHVAGLTPSAPQDSPSRPRAGSPRVFG